MRNHYNKPEFAGFFVRLSAYCIDMIAVCLGFLVFRGTLWLGGSFLNADILSFPVLFQYTLKDGLFYGFQVAYFVIFEYFLGGTPGKLLLKLRVVGEDGIQKAGLFQILYRETIGRFLAGISMVIGYIFVAVDREKRGLHDMLSDTRVVYQRKEEVEKEVIVL